MLFLDGSQGEGGGQILRSALALSLLTGKPFRLDHIRAGRKNPGLQRQHLTCVQAAARIGQTGTSTRGDVLGSRSLTFQPCPVQGGAYHFSIGTAGSCTLVLQTVLFPLLLAPEPSTLILEGGTHNTHSPPFDFIERTFLPLLGKMGASVHATLDKPGFYPAGGGRIQAEITPLQAWRRLDLLERGELRSVQARALLAHLPRDIGKRELSVVQEVLGWSGDGLRIESVRDSAGPGNALLLEIQSEHVTEIVTGFGEKGVRAEDIAQRSTLEAKAYLDAGVPVGEHLADQLLLPMALCGGGSFRTVEPSSHTRTNADVIQQFLPVRVEMSREPSGAWRIDLRNSG